MSFIQELKRRNVIRVAILYAVSSWVLLQLTDVLASLLTLPPWAGSFVIFLLLLGLFPALAFSWVYEMTSEGLKREKDIDRSTSIAPDTGKKINSVIVVLLIIAIVSLAADRLMPEAEPLADSQENSPVREEISPNTIAVLPFADMSAEGDQQYFTDGLSEELLNLLVRVDGLTVASRTTAFWDITWPLARPGVIAGCLLVFIPAMGEYVIPYLLGGPDSLLIGRVLFDEFFANRDWPLASAVAIMLLLLLVIPIVILQRNQLRNAEQAA